MQELFKEMHSTVYQMGILVNIITVLGVITVVADILLIVSIWVDRMKEEPDA